MSGPAPAWTRQMTAFLVRMRRRGRPYGWIARALGVTRAALVERATRMGFIVRARGGRRFAAATAEGEPAALGPLREVLGEGVCHWISGDTADRDWRMCGHPAVSGTRWCAHHHGRAYDREPPPADAAAPRRAA